MFAKSRYKVCSSSTVLAKLLSLGGTLKSHRRLKAERGRRRTDLRIESLESRNMFSVSSITLNQLGFVNVLNITADDVATTVQVDKIGSTIRVQDMKSGISRDFAAGSVGVINFTGGAKNDSFTSKVASIPVVAHGNGGDDKLVGSSGADTLYGDAGIDRIYGGAGNDRLYGGDGNDYLYGGNDKDALYGGNGNDVILGEYGNDHLFGEGGNDGLIGFYDFDEMQGGSGADRILTDATTQLKLSPVSFTGVLPSSNFYGSSSIAKLEWIGGNVTSDSQDAVVKFVNGSSQWTERELETVDVAFQTLQNRTGNTRLLKDSDGSQLKFVKEKSLKNGDLGINEEVVNTKSFLGIEYDRSKSRSIRIADWDESLKSLNDGAVSTVIHEIGHNWDSTPEAGRLFQTFADVSWRQVKMFSPILLPNNQKFADFTQYYVATSSGSQPYGMKNVKEDWSSTWEAYFDRSIAGSSTKFQQKLEAVDKFFNSLV